jgi:hypothetical protein
MTEIETTNEEYSKIILENTNNFDILLIKSSNIDPSLDWKDPNYTKNICDLDIYQVVTTNAENYLDDIAKYLDINNRNKVFNVHVETQVIAEFKDYVYELLYILTYDNKSNYIHDNDNINSVSTLLNLKEKNVYYNSILIKTYLPTSNNKSMYMVNCGINDVKYILDSRLNTTIVTFDGDTWEEKIIQGDLELFAKEFFDERHTKLELGFLKHNINIWYETFDGKNINSCGTLIKKPVFKCFWFTMASEQFRGSLLLDEVQKIIKLSYKLEPPYTAKDEWVKEENDEYNRVIVKNKYRVLEYVYNELCK